MTTEQKEGNAAAPTELTKEWSKFDGNYQKKMQDIKLFNGDIVMMCWPNAGFWCVCTQKGNENYYGKDGLKVSEAEYVRLTQHENW